MPLFIPNSLRSKAMVPLISPSPFVLAVATSPTATVDLLLTRASSHNDDIEKQRVTSSPKSASGR